MDKDKPEVGPHDALVKPLVVSACTSDMHVLFEMKLPREFVEFPRILGHEAVGEVVKVGDKVKDFRPGDIVGIPSITPDWTELEVQRGYPQHAGGMGGGFKLGSLFRGGKDGVFAEYFHVNVADANLGHMPEGVPVEAGVMFCMMTTGFHGAELANIPLGGSVLVNGVGPVGLMSVVGAKMLGAGRIIAVGHRGPTIELAKYYGANDIIDYKKTPDVASRVMELTGGAGVDSVIIAGGDTKVVDMALRAVKPGGTVANVNAFTEPSFTISAMSWGVLSAHKTVTGGICPGGRLRVERIMDLVKYRRVDPTKMITHRHKGFESIEKAFEQMKEKNEDFVKNIVVL